MSELRECPFCGAQARLLVHDCREDAQPYAAYEATVECTDDACYGMVGAVHKERQFAEMECVNKWNTRRPADAVRVKGEKFLHAVEAYHDAIKLRDDVENSHMWSCELRVMYAAMVEFRAALAQDGRG